MVSPAHIVHKEYWHKSYILFPRKTINGNHIRGECYKRDVCAYHELGIRAPEWRVEYATGKEVFEHKLKTGAA